MNTVYLNRVHLIVLCILMFPNFVISQNTSGNRIVSPNTDVINDNIDYQKYGRDKVIIKAGIKYKTNSANSKFLAKIDEKMVLPTNYVGTSTSVTRSSINTTLPVGTTNGVATVNGLGQAEYTIPVYTPPSTAKFNPNLSIKYESSGKDGILGIGWDLEGVSSIKRTGNNLFFDNKTQGITFTSTDNFLIDGQRLLSLSNSGGTTTYVCEVENNLRITAYLLSGQQPTWFKAVTIDGTTYEYGNSDHSTIKSVTGATIEWRLNKIVDPNGNYIEYKYKNYEGQDVLDKIVYTGNSNLGINPTNEINFYYDFREDELNKYIVQNSFLNKLVLRKITSSVANNVVKSYELKYANNIGTKLIEVIEKLGNNTPLNSTLINWGPNDIAIEQNTSGNFIHTSTGGLSALTSVGDVDNDGKTDILLYDPSDNHQNTPFVSVISSRNPTPSSSKLRLPEIDGLIVESSATLLDFDQDGKDEVYLFKKIDQTCSIVGFNYVNGNYSIVNNALTAVSFPIGSNNPTFQLIPINYSGKVNSTDIVILNTTSFVNSFGDAVLKQRIVSVVNNQNEQNTRLFDLINSQNNTIGIIDNIFYYRRLFFVDADGDGKTDILELNKNYANNENALLIYKYNEQNNSYQASYVKNNFLIDSDKYLQLGDANGDANFDVFATLNNQWVLYKGDGVGFDLEPSGINELNSITDLDKETVKFTDLNSDGYYDFSYLTKTNNNNAFLYKVNALYGNGSAFLNKEIGNIQRIYARCYSASYSSFPSFYELIDFDNDGNKDIFYLGSFTLNNTLPCEEGKFNYYLLKVTGGTDARKVVEIVNGYNNSAKFVYQNNLAYRTNLNYKRTLSFTGNFAVLNRNSNLVTQLIHAQHNSNNIFTIKSFTYENGVYNTLGKGFLGFTKIETITSWNAGLKNKIIINKYLNDNKGVLENTSNSFQVLSSETNNQYTEISFTTYEYEYAQNLPLAKQYRLQLKKETEQDNTTGLTLIKEYKNYTTLGYVGLIEEYYQTGVKKKTITNEYEQVLTTLGPNKLKSSTVHIALKPNQSNPSGVQLEHTQKTNYEYYANGNVKNVINFSNSATPTTTFYEYYQTGQVFKKTLSATNMPARTEKWIYDDKYKFAIKHYNINNQVSTFEYEPLFGNLVSQKTIEGFTTTFEYDVAGNRTKIKDKDGSITNYSLVWDSETNPNSLLYKEVAQNNDFTTTSTWYNTRGIKLVTSVINLSNVPVFTTWEYDIKDRLIKQTKPYTANQQESEKRYITYEYDKLDRLRKTIDDGQESRTDYSFEFDVPSGTNLIAQTGNQVLQRLIISNQTVPTYKLSVFNTDNELATVTDNNASINYVYHGNGKILMATAAGAETRYTYDYQGNRTAMSEPNAGNLTYTYDAYGQLDKQTDGRGFETDLDYNALGQIITKKVTDPASSSTPQTTTYTYNTTGAAINQIQTITSSAVVQNYNYNTKGNLSSYTENIQGQTFTTSYVYDNLNNLIQLTYPSGFSIKKEYFKGSLKRIKRADNNALIWEATTYNYLDMQTTNTLGNNMTHYITYDTKFNIQAEQVKYQNQAPLYHHSYQFNPNTGSLSQHQDLVNNLTESFNFDQLDRLTDVTFKHTNPEQQVAEIQYYPNGNIKKKTDISATDYSYGTTPPHAVQGIADPSISALPSFNQLIQFNAANRPTQILYNTHKLVLTYAADDERRKTEQYENNQLNKTTYYQAGFEREITATTSTDFNYIYANTKLVAIMAQTGATKNMYYTCTDYLDNINLLITQNRTIAQQNSVDAWGRRRNPTNWTYTNIAPPTITNRCYTGHQHLDDFGLINMNARLYDPYIGRMLSPDNVLQEATNSQNYNRYSYVLNNPLKYTDPTGNEKVGGPSAQPKGNDHSDFYNQFNNYMEYVKGAQQEKNDDLNLLFEQSITAGGTSDYAIAGVDLSNYQNSSQAFVQNYFMFDYTFGLRSVGESWDLNHDGKLQLRECAFHYRNGGGTPITVDGSKVSLVGLNPELFSGQKPGFVVSQNLLFSDFLGEGTVYGKLAFEYLGGNKVQIISNMYDFDTGADVGHPWFGTNSEFWRNVATKLGNVVSGPGIPFMINFKGPSTLSSYPK